MKAPTLIGFFSVLLLAVPARAHNGELILVHPLSGIAVDGDLSDWPKDLERHPIDRAELGNKPTDAQDFSGSFRIGYDPQENALYLAVEVEDQSTVLTLQRDYDERWQNRDGFAVAIDLEHGNGQNNSLHLGFWGDEEIRIFGGEHYGAGREHFDVVSQRRGTSHMYEWRLDVSRLDGGRYHLEPGTVLGLGIGVRDQDADGSLTNMTWGKGMYKFFSPDTRGDVLLVGVDTETAAVRGRVRWADTQVPAGRLRVDIAAPYLDAAEPAAWMSLETGPDGTFNAALPYGEYRLRVGRGLHPDEENTVLLQGTSEAADRPLVLSMHPPAGTTSTDAGHKRLAGPGRRNGPWTAFGPRDGVHSSTVDAMLQDRQGQLWITLGEKGLLRYDGESFTRYDSLDGRPIEARKLLEDRRGDLWIATAQGLLHHRDGGLTLFDRRDGLAADRIYALTEDLKGDLWIATHVGVSRFDGERFYTYTTADGLPANRTIRILADRKGRVWAATAGGVARFDGESFRDLSRPEDPPQFYINDLMEDRRGHIWVNTVEGGVWRYRGDEVEYFTTANGLGSNFTNRLGEDAEGTVWTTAGGLNRFAGDRFRKLGPEDDVPAAGQPVHLHLDRRGTFWVGTGSSGLLRATEEGFKAFDIDDGLVSNHAGYFAEDRDGRLWISHGQDGSITRYDNDNLRNFTVHEGLAHPVVNHLARDRRGRLWLATEGGLSCIDNERVNSLKPADGLPDLWVRTVAVDEQDRVWFASTSGGAFVGHIGFYDGEDFKLFDRSDGLESTSGRSFLPDGRGGIWVGLQSSLSHYDGRTFRTFTKKEVDVPWLWVGSMAEDTLGRLWFAVGNMAVRYDGQRFAIFGKEQGAGPTTFVFGDREGRLWFNDTQRGGAYRYDGEHFEHIGPAQGLEAENILCITQDDRGHMWFGTVGGAVRYDGRISQPFDRDDGLVNDRVNHILKDPDGSIWLATSGGVTRYKPSHTPPTLRLVGVAADHDYGEVEHLKVPSIQDLVAFEFRGRSMLTPTARMAYRYRLDGYDKDWRVDRTGRVQYEDLPIGDYTFEIQAVDRDLNYSQPLRVAVEVHPPYERLAWGLALGLALLLVGVQATRIVRDRGQLKSSNAALQTQKEDLRAARDQAESASLAKSEFLANISHEIRTPMNAILGYAQLLGRAELPADQQRAVDTIHKSGTHLLGLINEVLDLSKIESGHAEVRPIDFDLNGLLATLDLMFAVRCRQEGLGWRVEGQGAQPLRVHGDEAKLSQVLINLLGNAVKFTPAGEVKLKLAAGDDDCYTFAVSDTGPGISAAEHQHLFEPFQRGASTQQQEGTGLGLAIARRNVELLGGRLEVESAAGEGARFFFALHLPPAQGQPTATTMRPQRHRLKAGQQVRALVVDDVAENRDILRLFLQSVGVEVEVAPGGQEALTRIGAHPPDILFLDIRMPQLGGEEVLRRLRQDPSTQALPVVAVTASVLEHERQRFLDAGFADFVPKPFQAERIYVCLENVLGVQWEEEPAEETPTAERDWSRIELPAALRDQLLQAAKNYSVTDLEDGLKELEMLGEEERQLAAQLRQLKQRYDMEGIGRILKS